MILKFLAVCGGIAIISVVIAIVMLLWQAFLDWTSKQKRKYQYKHRFDKSPTAKCYCKDCTRYGESSGECFAHSGWRVADNWFCWSAEPRK